MRHNHTIKLIFVPIIIRQSISWIYNVVFLWWFVIFSITSFHFTSRSDLGPFLWDISERALVWWELYLLTSLQRAYFSSQLTTGSYFASFWKMSRSLWWLASLSSVTVFMCLILQTKWGYSQYSALQCMLWKSLTGLWREKNEKWRTLSDGINRTVQWVRKCSACSPKAVLSLGQ